MTIALPIRALAFPSRFHPIGDRSTFGTGLLQVARNPSEWKCAGIVALVFFVASLAIAPALTRDHQQLALEINAKTLKAAAQIQVPESAAPSPQRADRRSPH